MNKKKKIGHAFMSFSHGHLEMDLFLDDRTKELAEAGELVLSFGLTNAMSPKEAKRRNTLVLEVGTTNSRKRKVKEV